MQNAGGNYREIAPINEDRKIYKFNNVLNQGYNPMSMDGAANNFNLVASVMGAAFVML